MNNWKKCKLGDAPLEFIDGDRGKNYPKQNEFYSNEYCLFLSTKNVRENGFNFSECQFITKEKDDILKKGKLKINDLVLTTRGTIGNLALYKENTPYKNIRINSGMLIIRPNNEELDSRYAFYLFKNLKDEFDNFVSGSAQPQLPIRDLKEVEITLPPLEEQRQIAAILSSIDDKIELLHEQNKTLEKLAQTLFRHYFIENPNPTWQNVKLGDLVEVVDNRGKTPPLSNENTIYPVIEVNSLNGESRVINYSVVRKYIDKETYNTWFRAGHPKKYDVLISTVGSIGELAMFLDDIGSIAQNVVALRASSDYKCYLYEALKFMKNDLKELDIGSVQPSIKIPHLLSLAILKPNGLILQKFNDEVLKFIDKISSNVKQIQTLENMRDILIPKLLNGEIKINN